MGFKQEIIRVSSTDLIFAPVTVTNTLFDERNLNYLNNRINTSVSDEYMWRVEARVDAFKHCTIVFESASSWLIASCVASFPTEDLALFLQLTTAAMHGIIFYELGMLPGDATVKISKLLFLSLL